jgi:hypothetical protein
VAKINRSFAPQFKSPAYLTGLFCLLVLISGCQTPKTPEQVTAAFWTALIQADLETAKKFTTQNSQHLITEEEARENSTLNTGKIVINGSHATVETTMIEEGRTISFNTALLKEGDLWKIDYQQTLTNISAIPFNGIFKSLEEIGETLNEQLEQQMPLFEKQIESFGEELKQQLDEFGRYLENPKKWKKQHPYRDDSI